MRSGHGFVVGFSLTSSYTLEETETFMEQILRVKDADRWPMILVGYAKGEVKGGSES